MIGDFEVLKKLGAVAGAKLMMNSRALNVMPIGKASAPPTPDGGEDALRCQPTAGSGTPGRE